MRLNRKGRVSHQTAEVTETETSANPNVSTVKGTFSITVKDDSDKVLYENKEEPFEYEKVTGLSTVLTHAGAKLDESQIDFLNQALAGSEETGKAVSKLIELYNNKLKADEKSSKYQSLVNKYKPLEGEKKESAQARSVANFIKLASVSKEVAIERLKSIQALPEDYTVADFDSTPLRRTKGDSDE